MHIYCPTDCIGHENGPHHPESPDRLKRLLDLFKRDYAANLMPNPAPISLHECPSIHDKSYFSNLIKIATALTHSHSTLTSHQIDSDTALSQGSLGALEQCLGVITHASQTLIDQESQCIFCSMRPPGHHAEHDKAMGFCFINWAFLAAILLGQSNKKRVVIIDFDVHHGNGTDDLTRRHCKAGHDNIAYASLHESPLFPDTGLNNSTEKYTDHILNIPYAPYTKGNAFHDLWDQHIIPFVKAHNADYIILSAGFDAHTDDPLSTAQLSEDDFERLTYSICQLYLPILSILEGGYNLDALENSVTAHLDALLDM